jgi:hypothetical protein
MEITDPLLLPPVLTANPVRGRSRARRFLSTISNGDRTLWGVCVGSRLQEKTQAISRTGGLIVAG